MKSILAILPVFLCVLTSAHAQPDSTRALSEILAFQSELTTEYRDITLSPLEPEDFSKFKAHDFYKPDLNYRVVAKLTVTKNSRFFKMKTTRSQFQNYREYGKLSFMLNGKAFTLPVYQSKELMKRPGYQNYLFFPFTDLTNGEETYGGGRYIGLWIPKGKELVLDFNQAYNPYCAYSNRYACPIVPTANHMEIEVRAGVRFTPKK